MGKFLDEEPKLYKGKFLEEQPQLSPVMQTVSGMAQVPSKLFGTSKLQEYAENPKDTASKLLQGAQIAGQFALPVASGLTTTPLTEFGIQKLKGAETPEALKQAGIAGGLDLALTGAIAGGGKLVKSALRKIIPLATGIPEESVNIALKKPEIFKGKLNLEKTFDDLGLKAQQATNYIEKEAGMAVGKEKKAIRKLTKLVDPSSIATRLDRNLKIANDMEYLPPEDISKINYFSDKIKNLDENGILPKKLYQIRKEIDDSVSWAKKQVAPLSDRGDAILKNASSLINRKLAKISPEFKEVSKKYAEMTKLKQDVIPKLNDVQAGTNIQNIFSTGITSDKRVSFLKEFQEIDKAVPENLKFANKAKEVLARQQFEEWIPKKNLVSAARLSGLTLGGIGYGTDKPELMAGGLLLAGATSPKIYKSLIGGGSAIKRAMAKPAAQGTTKQLATQMLRLYNEE